MYGGGGYDAVAAPVVWTLHAHSGVRGFGALRLDRLALGQAHGDYGKDYRFLPYAVRCGDEHVLSRWNMIRQKLTVSRVQAVVRVDGDGTASLISQGKGPTLWRERGRGPWYALDRLACAPLSDGDMVSLDWHDPEAAVFRVTCVVDEQGAYARAHAQQQQQQQQGYAPGPAAWLTGVDERGAVYYYNEQTGQSQWEPPW